MKTKAGRSTFPPSAMIDESRLKKKHIHDGLGSRGRYEPDTKRRLAGLRKSHSAPAVSLPPAPSLKHDILNLKREALQRGRNTHVRKCQAPRPPAAAAWPLPAHNPRRGGGRPGCICRDRWESLLNLADKCTDQCAVVYESL